MSASPTPERHLQSTNGYAAALVGVVLIAGTALSFIAAPGMGLALILARVLLIATGVFVLVGLYMLQPREAAIMTLFGE